MKQQWFVVPVSLSYLSPHSRLQSDPVSPSDDPGEPNVPTGISRFPLGERHLSPRQTTGSFSAARSRVNPSLSDFTGSIMMLESNQHQMELMAPAKPNTERALQLLLFLNDFRPAASSMVFSGALLKRGCFRSLADILWGEKAGWSPIRSSEITGRPSACLEQRFQSATYTSCLGVHHVRAQLLWINHLSDFISPPLWCYCTLGLGSLPFFLAGVAA